MADGIDSPPGPAGANDPPLSRAVILAVLAASAAVAGFAISTQSYWIDEGLSLIVAMAPNPAEAWKYAEAVSGSTLQMPLYQVYLYVWHKVIGGGEWAMRASNIPLFLAGQLAFLLLLRHRPRLALTASLLALVSPLLWMYLDETRPYIMQYAAACWMVAGLVRWSSNPALALDGKLIAILCGATFVLFSSSLLGIVWAVAMAAAFFWLAGTAQSLRPARAATFWGPMAAAIVLMAACGFYYYLTWGDAARGYHRSGIQILSLPYLAYDFLGFPGFGPGKLQMRLAPVRSVLRSLPALLPLAAVLALLAIFALRQLRRAGLNRRAATTWIIALGLPIIIIFGALFIHDSRPLPRHFIPALPAVLLGAAAVMQLALAQRSAFWRAVAIMLPLLWLASALNLRWQPAHAKDDYRTAAAIAAAALRNNKEVWWAADAAAAYVYLTPVAMEETPGRAWAMQGPSWDDIRYKFPPRVIIISKPDIYDPQGAIARYAAENQFLPARQLQAFTIFTRHGEPLPTVK
jgi:hypothetical protein